VFHTTYSCIFHACYLLLLFHSCVFHPCYLLLLFPLPLFPPLQFWPYRIFHSRIFSRPLTVTCGLTACIPGSAPGPMLGNEYRKPLPFYHLYLASLFGVTPLKFRRDLWLQKTRVSVLFRCCLRDPKFSSSGRTFTCDRQIDRRTHPRPQHLLSVVTTDTPRYRL